ncbi:protein TASOR [Chanos chanos]|uniref:Protein TASOR n=1 Tax=Chanos chanos TaxID=29144 RepID=A0A6J2UYW2_CHACN|nr:protein TASOR-like [Chanos chanos]
MAYISNQERTKDKESFKTGGLTAEDCESKKQLLSASTSATSKQNGDQAGCEDEQMSEQDASERRRSGPADLKNCSNSPSTFQRSTEELPRRNFQIPRKIKEKKGLVQQVPPDSREFEDIVKLLSSFYLDSSSRGSFTYTKVCLIHNELLEKEFVEKKRELKQAGRTDTELTESYGFLLPDKNKTQYICEKGLCVGHARINTLGNPVKGVYLSKYSDLLQINPFEVGASGDIIIFKIMKGRLKTIHDNMPKSNLEPSPKFDGHVSKNACKVTSRFSYRGFERTQQYFFEFAFEELRSRPRHVCPYAVVSFQYKGKESAAAALRIISTVHEGPRVRRKYTVWSGPLVNKGEELYQICIRSSSHPFLPYKLPEKLDISMKMHLEQIKRKIPSVLLSWDTYVGSNEVLKFGMYCSLFEVISRSKQGNSLSGLLHQLEREKIVLVKPLIDRGFLFLLSSSHLHSSNERRGRTDRGLQALFIFQEPRMVSRFMSRHPEEDSLASLEPKDPIIKHIDAFIPALHQALLRMRANPTKDLAAGVKRQAMDYLNLQEQGAGRPFHLPEYRSNLDERVCTQPPSRPKVLDSMLNSYLYGPSTFQLPVVKIQALVESSTVPGVTPPAGSEDYSPVSDWGGSDRQATASGKLSVAQSNGGAQRTRLSQGEYDKEKMEKLLRLIQLRKRTLGKEEGSGADREEEAWDPVGLKRTLEDEGAMNVSKYLRTDLLSNGEPGRVPLSGDHHDDGQSLSLSMVMDSMGIGDTDLRARVSQGNTSFNEAQLKLFKAFLNMVKTTSQGSNAQAAEFTGSLGPNQGREPSKPDNRCDLDLRTQLTEEDPVTQIRGSEVQTPCSLSSVDVYSPSSSIEQPTRPAEVSNQKRVARSAPITDQPSECDGGHNMELAGTPGKSVDDLLSQEFQCLCTEIQGLMESQQIYYISQPPLQPLDGRIDRLNFAFSPFVSRYVSPIPVQGHVNTLCEKMNRLIHSPSAPLEPAVVRSPAVVSTPAAPLATTPVPTQVHAPTPVCSGPSPISSPQNAPAPHCMSLSPAPNSVPLSAAALSTKLQTPVPKSLGPMSKSKAPTNPVVPVSKKQLPHHGKSHHGTVKETSQATTAGNLSDKTKVEKPKMMNAVNSPTCQSSVGNVTLPPIPPIPDPPPDPSLGGSTSAVGNSVIGQLKPDVSNVLCTLVEIMQMHTVMFYIELGDEVESQLCAEIKEYLKSLGNIECNPQTYLENNGQQKFMVIIQNEDIASHVHKIPALVSLKKLPTVYFAGVDSLDDVKNRTYNELFVSGGLVVSDESVLNPDFITLGKLQAFLKFLEEQSSPWKWKVHCKTQKRLKELSRMNSEALDLLNLLTAYQKKHLVEFLPYHECDTPLRQAPDLDCLVKLQAQHTQLRHIIFLTESHSQMSSQFSSSGIMTASMDEIMNSFHSLVSFISKTDGPTLPATVEEDECVQEEDMSIDSEDDTCVSAEPLTQRHDVLMDAMPPQPPPPQIEEFQPPLPNQPVLDPLLPSGSIPFPTQSSYPTDYGSLSHLSQYAATNQGSTTKSEIEDGLVNFGVNPHQSYLCSTSAQWSPYSNSSGYPMPSPYPTSSCPPSQGQEYAQQTSVQPLAQPSGTAAEGLSTQGINVAETAPAGNPLSISDSVGALGASAPPTGSVNKLVLCGSQDAQSKAIEPAPQPSPHPSSLSYSDPTAAPIPPVLGYSWGTGGGVQHSYAAGLGVGGYSGLSSAQTEGAGTLASAAGSGEGLWATGNECGTPNSQVGGSTPNTSTPGIPGHTGGGEKSSTPGSLTPSSQGSRTPVNSSTESQVACQAGAAPSRGGTPSRGLLPIPGAAVGSLCRGGVAGVGPHGNSSMYGSRGGISGTMDGSVRGGFRGRGIPPPPMRSRPFRGQIRGGSNCNWGYPPGRGGGGNQDYYSDYPYP